MSEVGATRMPPNGPFHVDCLNRHVRNMAQIDTIPIFLITKKYFISFFHF